MANCKFIAEIKYSWYVRKIYIPSLYLFVSICDYIGIEIDPNWDLIMKTITKNSVVKIKTVQTKTN